MFPFANLRKSVCGLLAVGTLLLAPAARAGYLDLTWEAPTTNVDGTALTDLAAYRVYFGITSPPCQGNSFHDVAAQSPEPSAGETVTFRLDGLDTGTLYQVQVTALDTTGNESFCSNEASGTGHEESQPSTGDGGGGCFIATASYGSPLAPQVVLLRAFRDRYLMTNSAGRAFVRWYYRISPPLAAKIRQSSFLKILVRTILWPLVGTAWLILHPSVVLSLVMISGCVIGLRWRRGQPATQRRET